MIYNKKPLKMTSCGILLNECLLHSFRSFMDVILK